GGEGWQGRLGLERAGEEVGAEPTLHLAEPWLRADRRAPGGGGELERRGGLRRLVEPQRRQELPAAHRGRVGIRVPGRHDDAIFLWGRCRRLGGGRERRGWDGESQTSRLDRDDRCSGWFRVYFPRGPLSSQCLGPV